MGGCHPPQRPEHPVVGLLKFQLTLVLLVAVIVIVPYSVVRFFDLDGRTPLSIAQDTLHDKYRLVLTNSKGVAIPDDSSLPTVSEFSLKSGSTTQDVRFLLHGQQVRCDVRIPDGPDSATATCSPDPNPSR